MKISSSLAQPILVTGAPRSGTTFLGRMLSLYHRVTYIDEPFNYQMGMVGVRRQFVHLYEGAPEEEYYRRLTGNLLAGRARFKSHELSLGPRGIRQGLERLNVDARQEVRYRLTGLGVLPWRYLIKDPMACFSAEYLHREFAMPVVVVVRHPAAVVASYKRLGWRFGLADLTSQPELMERYLMPILANVDADGIDSLDEGALLWTSIYKMLIACADRNPRMLVVRHEDLAADPVHMIRKLYGLLSMPFSPWIEERIREHTGNHNPITSPSGVAHELKRYSRGIAERWHGGLTQPELSRIREMTGTVAHRYYNSDDWVANVDERARVG